MYKKKNGVLDNMTLAEVKIRYYIGILTFVFSIGNTNQYILMDYKQ